MSDDFKFSYSLGSWVLIKLIAMNFIWNIRIEAFSISAVVKIIFAYVVKKVSKFRVLDKKVSKAKEI